MKTSRSHSRAISSSGGDELSLQDFSNYQQRQQHEHKNGFLKIQSCCARALSDGYAYAWIDTVCIDERSSAEITEAINSMYHWYAKAAVCYAYLEDLASEKESVPLSSDLKRCRWFTRSWTLQELIAPKTVIFFNKSWDVIGERKHLAHQLSSITGIDCKALLGNPIRMFSIASRISWASRRETTRAEDLGYCLLGIFGINMPLLYGEGGQRAFFRLQHEILCNSNNQSIFAWSIPQSSLGTASLWSPLTSSPSFF
ncbi:hypothetical protein B0T26DRAFT_742034 [Lasiosphaeria miniovina]|uniref:Heterokaryon incompatibility domain-containing protein n=1 Tax=Lasiosphaeria miniovina TaxID=1954250 RepID=A0AA40ACG6_9PEZI|nr:uncharacterized protein B0T26DRAFT_742034 [Lasiosphaeria miniovina]KAK0713229.1 hypothetical protein B0T26DRAFT_742034 [Lasiosphaeria miniovina]